MEDNYFVRPDACDSEFQKKTTTVKEIPNEEKNKNVVESCYPYYLC